MFDKMLGRNICLTQRCDLSSQVISHVLKRMGTRNWHYKQNETVSRDTASLIRVKGKDWKGRDDEQNGQRKYLD